MLEDKPDIICVQETWLSNHFDFRIRGYTTIHRDRSEGNGGRCATFIRQGMNFHQVLVDGDLEVVSVEIWESNFKCRVINFYNPCRR